MIILSVSWFTMSSSYELVWWTNVSQADRSNPIRVDGNLSMPGEFIKVAELQYRCCHLPASNESLRYESKFKAEETADVMFCVHHPILEVPNFDQQPFHGIPPVSIGTSPHPQPRWGDLHKRHIRRRRRVQKSSDPAIDIDLMCSWLLFMHFVCALTIWHSHTQSWQQCRICSPGGVDMDFSQNDSNRIWSFPDWDWMFLVFMVQKIQHFQTAIRSASRESQRFTSPKRPWHGPGCVRPSQNGLGDLCDICCKIWTIKESNQRR